MIVLGLRFKRRDAGRLRALAAQVRSSELGGHSAKVFTEAARAAELGEPLELHCTDPIEAVQMAAAYVQFGVTAPVIEELSGHRPA
jgi:hypothetical protein